MSREQIGGRIVTDGLVLMLDAGNEKSYPGTGTTFYDLSGNGNNGTLYGNTSYSSVNGGVLTFDGSGDYVKIPSIDLRTFLGISHTIIAAARYVANPKQRIISAISNNWLLGWWGNQTDKYYANGWVSSTTGGASVTDWIVYAGTGDVINDQWGLYKNGQLLITPNSGGDQGPWGLQIGGTDQYSEDSNCEVSYVLVYNRVLTADEVLQNFNATRHRFGL